MNDFSFLFVRVSVVRGKKTKTLCDLCAFAVKNSKVKIFNAKGAIFLLI